MTKIDLSEKAILITGALGAIAEHLVRKLANAGARLVLTDLKSENEATQTLQQWQIPSASYVYCQADLTDSKAVNYAVQQGFQHFPALDTVIGHAGGCGLHPFAVTSESDYEHIFRFNYFAQTYVARDVLRYWVDHHIAGHLMFTSSYVARVPHTRIPAYASAKAALENFARCLALEYASAGIRVNLVSPGNVAAGASLKVFEQDAEYRDFVLRVTPSGKRNSPEGIGDAYVFLCSPLANEINGQVISVDWGITIPKIG